MSQTPAPGIIDTQPTPQETAAVVHYSARPMRTRVDWRLVARAGAIAVLLLVAVYVGDALRWRMRVVDRLGGVGPVSWGSVVRSPVLLELAWRIASDPRAFDPLVFRPPTRFNDIHILEGARPHVRDCFGVGDFSAPSDLGVVTLLSWTQGEDGVVTAEFLIENNRADPLVVPPLRLKARRHGVFEKSQSAAPPLLGEGVFVLDPGQQRRVHLTSRDTWNLAYRVRAIGLYSYRDSYWFECAPGD